MMDGSEDLKTNLLSGVEDKPVEKTRTVEQTEAITETARQRFTEHRLDVLETRVEQLTDVVV